MQTYQVGANQAGQRLDKFLKKFMPEAGSNFLYKMLRKKNIILNGKKADGSEILNLNDIISFYFSDETYQKFTGQTEASFSYEVYEKAFQSLKGIKVVFENEAILVLNKPAGILSQKADNSDLSINEWMIGYLLDSHPDFEKDILSFKPSVCNRLDRNTSGLVLCGKSLAGTQYLSRLIHDRKIRKFYHTICIGTIDKPSDLKGFLIKDEKANRVYVSANSNGNPDESYIETTYFPIKQVVSNTLLEVELITGKPHQIRAHLASIGHPIVGDEKYGNHKKNLSFQKKYGIRHQLLHACRIEFPADEEAERFGVNGMVISVEDPDIFNRFLD